MPGFGNIRKLAREATSAAERARDASKERLSSVDTDQLSQRVRDTAEKTVDAASQSTDQLSQQVRAASEKVVNTAKSSTSASQDFLDEANSRVAGLTEQTLEFSSEAIDKIFPECSAPMYMMPTGSGQEDYALVFQFDEIIENLNVGVLVRPKIEAWSSGGKGYDLERLGEEIQREFTNQFTQARESQDWSVKELEAAAQKISDEIESVTPGISAYVEAVLLQDPSGVVEIILSLQEMKSKRRQEGEFKDEAKRLNRSLSELDSKNKTFERAVRKIKIRTHPKLQELHHLICDVESVPFPFAEVKPASNAPDISPYLRHPEFLRKLPDDYHGLLTAY
ncbi:MAG: hypothetical protein OXC95_10045 [Dehalococcoidia bacterium]|nr:hypothetical protein [Dehalococcoidia bacterium]